MIICHLHAFPCSFWLVLGVRSLRLCWCEQTLNISALLFHWFKVWLILYSPAFTFLAESWWCMGPGKTPMEITSMFQLAQKWSLDISWCQSHWAIHVCKHLLLGRLCCHMSEGGGTQHTLVYQTSKRITSHLQPNGCFISPTGVLDTC